MYPIVATFDDILHVHRNEAFRAMPRHTVFSFISDFNYTPYVMVPGFPRLEKGMKVVALLRSEGDWKTLVGWRDLDTGELAAPDAKFHANRAIAVLIGFAIGLCIGFLRLSGTFSAGLWLLAILLVIGGTFAYVEYRRMCKARADAEELQRLPSEAEPLSRADPPRASLFPGDSLRT